MSGSRIIFIAEKQLCFNYGKEIIFLLWSWGLFFKIKCYFDDAVFKFSTFNQTVWSRLLGHWPSFIYGKNQHRLR